MFFGDNRKILNYTTKKRLKETKHLKYNSLIDNKKKLTKIIKNIEKDLALLSKNTTYLGKAEKFVKIKLKLKHAIGKEKNYNDYLRKLNWYSYINKRRHEDKLLNNIKEMYRENATIIIGDWGNKGRLSFISTPNIGLKRLLKRNHNVFTI